MNDKIDLIKYIEKNSNKKNLIECGTVSCTYKIEINKKIYVSKKLILIKKNIYDEYKKNIKEINKLISINNNYHFMKINKLIYDEDNKTLYFLMEYLESYKNNFLDLFYSLKYDYNTNKIIMFQLLICIYTLKKHNLIHDDMNLTNYIIKKNEFYKENTYIKYKIEKKKIFYIPNTKFIICLIDYDSIYSYYYKFNKNEKNEKNEKKDYNKTYNIIKYNYLHIINILFKFYLIFILKIKYIINYVLKKKEINKNKIILKKELKQCLEKIKDENKNEKSELYKNYLIKKLFFQYLIKKTYINKYKDFNFSKKYFNSNFLKYLKYLDYNYKKYIPNNIFFDKLFNTFSEFKHKQKKYNIIRKIII